jgi:hypothetical protein
MNATQPKEKTMGARRQRTFEANGEKITIITTVKTSMGNKVGFTVRINGEKFFKSVLTAEEAEDRAYAAWVRRQLPKSAPKFAGSICKTCNDCGLPQWIDPGVELVCINCGSRAF